MKKITSFLIILSLCIANFFIAVAMANEKDSRCDTAQFYVQDTFQGREENPSETVVALSWKTPANFPEPSESKSVIGEFTISCEDFIAEQRNGVFRIRGINNIFDAYYKINIVSIFDMYGWKYPEIMVGGFSQKIWAQLNPSGIKFMSQQRDISTPFRTIIIAARVNDGQLIPILFDNKDMNGKQISSNQTELPTLQIGPDDIVDFYIKDDGSRPFKPKITRFSLNMKLNEVVLYSNSAFPSN